LTAKTVSLPKERGYSEPGKWEQPLPGRWRNRRLGDGVSAAWECGIERSKDPLGPILSQERGELCITLAKPRKYLLPEESSA